MDKSGSIFEAAKSKFMSGETGTFVSKFNPSKSVWGSHIALLSSAALSTDADILELGTGFFSTPLLHDIAQRDGGMVVSVDTELSWLSQFHNMTGPGHQIMGVPVYQDGANCGHYPGEGLPTLSSEKISFVGNVQSQEMLKSNADIQCPSSPL